MSLRKMLSLLLVIVAVSVAKTPQDEFEDFIVKYGRHYATAEERAARFANFQKTLAAIESHKNSGSSYTIGINQFADRSLDELPLRKSRNTQNRKKPIGIEQIKANLPGVLPASVDWRKQGVVSPVVYGGQCASCYHFSSVESAESFNKIKTGEKLVPLSAQQLIDCAGPPNSGCDGTSFEPLLDYLVANGSCSADEYPYVIKTTPCRPCKQVFSGYRNWGYLNGTEDALAWAVALGPLTVAVGVDSRLMAYSGGVYDSDHCDQVASLGLNIVGYDTDENGTPYWIMKNSWSPDWGEHGYIRMVRGKNMCNLLAEAIVTL